MPSALADAVASNLSIKVADKQALLGELNPSRRLEMVFAFMEGELGVLQVEKKIRSRVKRQMEKTQREYYLNEQLKAIQRELGNESEEGGDELPELAEKIRKTRLRKEARTRANAELKKLRAMAPMSAEATVARNYLDVLLGLPWGKKSQAQEGHRRGADGARRGPLRAREGQGPDRRISRGPGAHQQAQGADPVPRRPARRRQDLARPLDRPRDRAASSCASRWAACATRPRSAATAGPTSARCPGKIISNMKKAGTSNPLFLLDEIDKLGQDFRGDPSSALLEVLDPEQNSKFQDHYLELDYDLSDVMFVTTANSLDMPQPLLDRMEIIRLEGYTEDEKVEIAKRHLIPKQMEAHGLKPEELVFTDDALREMIRHYTREAGVRTLERELAKVARKSLRQILESKTEKVELTPDNLGDFLGRPQVPLRHGRGRGPDRRGHRPRLDRGRRRAADDRGGHRSRQGPDQDHRQARRSDAGVDPGGDELRQGARAGLWHQAVDLRAQGHPRPLARRRGAQGRSVRRHRHGHGDDLDADRHRRSAATSR